MAFSIPVSAADIAAATAANEVPASASRRFLREMRRKKTAVLGLALATIVLAGALAAPLLAPADPLAMSPRRLGLPSASSWLGTDQFGRDVLSRLLFGARVSMAVAFSAVGLAACLGAA